MKTTTLILALGISSIASADILLPNQAVISGEDAKAVNTKIAQVTGKTPTEFRGRKTLTANAQVVCFEFENGQVSCKIGIQK